jgi:hypothetical protein
MADHALELADVRRYRANASEATVSGIVKHYGIALQKPHGDAALVSGTDKTELATLRDKFLKKKLGLTQSDADLDAAIAKVMETMKGDNRKRRVTASYLLAEHFGKLSVFG